MPIVSCGGNLFDSSAQVLVNPVNCVGVMGAGLAKEFKLRFPEIMGPYSRACQDTTLQLGGVMLLGTSGKFQVLLFPTKHHWRDSSRLEWVRAGLQSTRTLLEKGGIESIALPRIGCGLGGLSWNEVRPEIFSALGDLSCCVELFE